MDQLQMWWLSLGIFALVVVVVAVLLGLIIGAAKSIDRHAAQIWTVGKQIAGNTVSIWMLENSVDDLRSITRETRAMAATAKAMDERLCAIIKSRASR